MAAATPGDPAELEAAFERAEHVRQEAADAEHAAYVQWQQAFGAYEAARDAAESARNAWVNAIA